MLVLKVFCTESYAARGTCFILSKILVKVIGPAATGRVIGIGTFKAFVGVGEGFDVVAEEPDDVAAAFCVEGTQIRHILLLPSLLHTYRVLGVSKKAPTFLHALPTLGGVGEAKLGVAESTPVRRDEMRTRRILHMPIVWQSLGRTESWKIKVWVNLVFAKAAQ
jgi:hypothetical protein